jgi:ribonuclease HI
VPIVAKYPTSCVLCSTPVSPGESIAKVSGRWAHASCAPSQESTLLEGAAPEILAKVTAKVPAKVPARAVKASMAEAAGALEVWTDGACSGNPGPGGWAWATKDGRQGSGGVPATTNQRMEVQAALEALLALEGPLVVVSDSTYVVNCFRDAWWKGWLARGWVNSAKKPVANRDLWEPLITQFRERGDVSFRWVKGHSGDPMNDLVDRLAVAAGKSL